MTLATDLAAEWQHDEATETVTLASRDGQTTDAEVKAFRSREQSKETTGGSFGTEPQDQVWEVWAATCDFAPAADMTITVGGTVWTIIAVSDVIWNAADPDSPLRYICPCRKQVS